LAHGRKHLAWVPPDAAEERNPSGSKRVGENMNLAIGETSSRQRKTYSTHRMRIRKISTQEMQNLNLSFKSTRL
jgi:hypothetical protein